jgi:hypothetical protein
LWAITPSLSSSANLLINSNNFSLCFFEACVQLPWNHVKCKMNKIWLKSNDYKVSQTGHWQQFKWTLCIVTNSELDFLRWPFWKWRPVEILQCRESIPDIIIYPHMKFRWNQTMLNLCSTVVAILKMSISNMKFRWNRTMLNLCGIVASILKMPTGRNFSMSGHHYLPTYQILMISDNVEFLRYCGGHFENGGR